MIDVGAMIKKLREERQWTQIDLAKKLHITKQTVSNYEVNRRSPNYEMLEALADTFNVPMSFFLTSEEEQAALRASANAESETRQKPEPTIIKNAIPYIPARAMVPVVGSVRCGSGGLAYQDLQGSELADVANPSDYFYLRAEGDSMSPNILPGDLVLVHIQPEVESGQLAVVVVDGEEGMLKKWVKKDNAVVLQSFNPIYPPRIFVGDEMEQLMIAGRVVETKRRW